MPQTRSMASIIATALSALAAPGQAAPTPVFDPDEFYVAGLAHEGSGCGDGSISFNIAPDAGQLTVLIGDFQVDPGHTSTCKLDLLLHVPKGWTFAPVAAELLGHSKLSGDAIASQSLAMLHNGRQQVTLANHTWKGPLKGNYRIHDIPPSDLWQTCAPATSHEQIIKLSLISTTELQGKSSSLLGLLVDGELHQRLKLSWRSCQDFSAHKS